MGQIVKLGKRRRRAWRPAPKPQGKGPLPEFVLALGILMFGGLCYDQYRSGEGFWGGKAEAEAPIAFARDAGSSQGSPSTAARPGKARVISWGPSVSVVDGDTFWYGGDKIRVADIDAPETHPPRCAFEEDLGNRATQRLRQLLRAGPFDLVPITGRDHDQYGRKLRVVVRNGRSLGDQLVSEGLARTWTGRREPWC